MIDLYLGLGTNLGDRIGNLQAALRSVSSFAVLVAVSRVYETAPLYVTDQPSFYNMAVHLRCDLPALSVLDRLKAMEQTIGRTQTFRYGPRIIDLDILLYGDLVFDHPRLTIPHPRLPERHFALAPLADLAKDVDHPVLHSTIGHLLQSLPPSDDLIRVVADGLPDLPA